MIRRILKPRTVRVRLLLAALLVEACMLTLLVANSVRLLDGSLTEQARLQAQQIAPVLNAALVAPLAQMDIATVQAILDESHAVEEIAYLVVSDQHDRVVAASGWPQGAPLPDAAGNFSAEGRGDDARYDVRVPVRLAGRLLGHLQIGLSLDHITQARKALVVQSVAIAVGELLLSVGLLVLVGWWLTRRLTRLTEAASAVAKGDYRAAPAEEGEDDVGRLGVAFNTMTRAVNERLNDLKTALDERAQVAGILDQERARLLALLSAMEFGVLFADSQGRVVYANPAFDRLWGRGRGNVGRPVEDVVLAPQLLAGGEAELDNGRIVTSHCFPVTEGRSSTGTLWTFMDMTASRLFARELLAAKDAAEAASDAKATFLATMSHEIRTPMNGIIGMSELLLDTALAADQRHYANVIRTSSEALLVVLNDILDFSKIDAGKLTLEIRPFEIRPLAESVIDILTPRMSGGDIRLRCHISPDADGIFLSDAGRLRQVLLNLVGNAVKFTEKGRIDVSITVETLENDQAWLRVSVEDTGIGIAPEALASLFQSFTQADASTARRFGGTGLGLAISKRIVELMGGSISCSSREGEGTTIAFTVPVQRAVERRQCPRDRKLVSGVRVMAVSHDPDFLAPVLPMLERLGVETAVLCDATVALSRLRQDMALHRATPVLFLDDGLIGVTAADLALLIRADACLRAVVPVLAATGPAGEVAAPIAHAGFGHVIRRPLDCRSVHDLLARVCGTMPVPETFPSPAAAQGLRILVAEDNAINQQVAVGLLQKLGHAAEVAEDGVTAVAMAERGRYDLVLMDMQMPGMSGLDAARTIRAMAGPWARVPIVAMTANAMRGDREQCMAAGMDDYISKPIDRAKLATLLDHWRQRIASSSQTLEQAG